MATDKTIQIMLEIIQEQRKVFQEQRKVLKVLEPKTEKFEELLYIASFLYLHESGGELEKNSDSK